MKAFIHLLSVLLLSLMITGCAAPVVPSPILPEPTPTPVPVPNPQPVPVPNVTPIAQTVRMAIGHDREVAEALRGVSAGFADCLRRDSGKVKNTEQLREAWTNALSFQFEGTQLFRRTPGLGNAVDAVIIEAMGGLESKTLTDGLRLKAAEAFDSISAACKGI